MGKRSVETWENVVDDCVCAPMRHDRQTLQYRNALSWTKHSVLRCKKHIQSTIQWLQFISASSSLLCNGTGPDSLAHIFSAWLAWGLQSRRLLEGGMTRASLKFCAISMQPLCSSKLVTSNYGVCFRLRPQVEVK